MARRRRNDWSAWAVPHLQRATAKGLDESGQRARRLGGTNAQMLAAAEDSEKIASIMRRADAFWVSADMAMVALDGSQDIPGFTPEDLPSDTGLLLVEKPLPDMDVTSVGGLRLRDPQTFTVDSADTFDPVPVDGVLWWRDGRTATVWPLVRTKRLPGPLYGANLPLTPFMSLSFPMPADFTADRSFLGPEGVSVESDSLGVLSWLAAAWHFMGMPTVTQVREARLESANLPTAPRGPAKADAVRLIDLRPMRHVREEAEESTERVYRHRWVVRGHWRQQAVGPKRADRRLTWIPSYTKGPEGAPLASPDIVRVWRR